MIMVTMIMTVALRAGDTVSSRMEWCPPAVEKGGSSVFSPSNGRIVTNQKLHQKLSKTHNIGDT